MHNIRNSVRAIIIDKGEIILTKNKEAYGINYYLPGGGQNFKEELTETVKRECKEEIGLVVVPEKCVFVREYIGEKHKFKETDSDIHQVEFYFICSILERSEPTKIDERQISWLSVPLEKFYKYKQNFYPQSLIPYIMAENFSNLIFLGSDI
ncbi:NUDIX domain-containing protein [Lactococcus lactis]|uniref:NUDIX domain-containing protein n=1 Tax=Lactococcus lactis TaxID=1358 RepID=UPI0032E4586B